MADFSIASQIRPMQLPDQLQQYAQFNQLALHQAQLAEVQRAANEQNQLRSLLESGVDRNSPEFLKQVYRISPTTGMTLEKGQAELQNAGLTRRKTEGEIAAQGPALQKSRTEAMLEDAKHYRSQLNSALANPDDATAAAVYNSVLADVRRAHPEIATKWPERFDRATITSLMQTPEQTVQAQAAARLAAQPQMGVGPGNIPVFGNRAAGTFVVGQDVTNAPPAAGAPFAAPANAPAAVMRQPAAATAAPAIGDAYLRSLDAAEGRDKNSRSTAQGFGQFLNGTFVDTAKKVFPELASKSPAEILSLRGTKLADGTPIESALEQRFRTDNIASLTSAGIQPTPGNVYLAHFLGAGGARNVLSADPNTPLSQVVSADAIKANPEVLAIRNKTVGDLQNWANSKFGNEPGLAASMTASNARLGGAPAGFVPTGGAPMSLGAPTANNALMASMMAGQAAPANMLAAPAPPQLAAPAAMPVAGAPAVAPAVAPVQPPLGGMTGLRAQVAREKLAEERSLAEARAQAAADVKRGEEAKDITRAKEKVAPTLAGIVTAYKNLAGRGELISAEGDQTLMQRAKIGALAALPSKVTTVLSPKTGSDITTIENLRRDLIPTIVEMTGAKAADAVAEMNSILNSLTTPGQADASVVATLNNFGKKYGLGELLSLEDLRPAGQNAAAAPPESGVPRGRRGEVPAAAAAPNQPAKPTLDQFLARVTPLNPNASAEELTAYYNRTYGGR